MFFSTIQYIHVNIYPIECDIIILKRAERVRDMNEQTNERLKNKKQVIAFIYTYIYHSFVRNRSICSS
jgi:hypothetical protein